MLFRALLLAVAVLLVGVGCLVGGRDGRGGQLLLIAGMVLAGVAVVFAVADAAAD